MRSDQDNFVVIDVQIGGVLFSLDGAGNPLPLPSPLQRLSLAYVMKYWNNSTVVRKYLSHTPHPHPHRQNHDLCKIFVLQGIYPYGIGAVD